ncbi:HTH-type transcriptional activator RhaS [Paenibacillus solanacearum]|uniref:HTH-type transcriptional activator RhaS n=1 Tax=Paenibacillus solanacearum TaxID=2048548 RepID=A0A916K871_9BACL|nr:AraC family transcriptional regulator [Paenibacillus solanacearum]CAG7652635.1 HTH-type transcriptional activator RhaS [Paenibacillus solanacearum]
MDIYKEPIHYQNPVLCIKVWKFEAQKTAPSAPAQNVRWHYHKEVELILVRQGVHELHTPSHSYTLHPGDVVIVGSSQLHRSRFVGSEKVVYIVLHVDLEPYFDAAMMRYYRHFSEVHYPLEELNYMFRENENARAEVGRIIERIHDEVIGKSTGYEIAASMLIRHLLLTLLRGDTRGLLQAHDSVDLGVMKPILDYVDDHLAEKIEMEKVSQIAGMSYFYFSKYFKKSMGESFTDYVNRKRIAKAERLLVMSGQNVGDIARAVGIENMAHFYELFKRFNGCTPKQYLSKIDGAR